MSMIDSLQTAFIGGSAVAAMTWFFSSRPRLFIYIFVPSDDLLSAGRRILRRDEFRRGMRQMAGLQFAVACAFGLAALWFGR